MAVVTQVTRWVQGS